MTLEYNGTTSTSGSTAQSFNVTESYNTVYVSSTTYKIDMNIVETSASGGESIAYTVWILKNGTISAIYYSVEGTTGFNLTGSEAQSSGVGAFAGFIAQIEASQELNIYTASNYFHSTGTSSVTIGPTTMTVTNYAANTLPVTVNNCNGTSTTLTAYALSVGTPPSASAPLVTYEHFAGTTTESNGQIETFNVVIQVTSITLA